MLKYKYDIDQKSLFLELKKEIDLYHGVGIPLNSVATLVIDVSFEDPNPDELTIDHILSRTEPDYDLYQHRFYFIVNVAGIDKQLFKMWKSEFDEIQSDCLDIYDQVFLVADEMTSELMEKLCSLKIS